ncbi:O-antigen ligase family protein [Bacteroides acidifaciens]|nr:O-antigen ligase family protein [Bacteroides acidifaciens]
MKQNFFAIGFNATNAPTIIRILIQGGLNIKEINCFPNHLLSTKIEMIKLFHILFAATCIGSMFVYSHQFTDAYIMPKWFWVLFVLLWMLVCAAFLILQRKSVVADMAIWGSIIVFSCWLQAVYGILQYIGLFSSHATFRMTGSFDNPAGFAACLCAGLPFGFFLIIHRNKYIRYAEWLAGGVMVLAIFLSHSRSGMVSIIAVCVMYLCGRFIHGRWWRYLLSVSITGLLIIGSYWLKKDSADGRLLIWQCGLEMVKDAPWTGHGTGSFEAKYMDYQADYFKEYGLQSRYAMLADNVKHPFNEYLGVLINFGIIGLALLLGIVWALVYCYKQNPTQEKKIALYALLSIGVFSFFSYPFMYPFTWIVTFLAILMLTVDYWRRIKVNKWGRYIMYTAAMMCFFWGLVRLGERAQSERSWREASKLALCRSYDKALPYYVSMKHQFRDNPYFLYNYAAVLTETKEYEKALDIALECRRYWADYNLELMIGENYQHLNKMKQAKIYYKNASMMCPIRFVPLNFLYDLYEEAGEKKKALEVAKKVMEIPVKVNSLIVNQIRYKMKHVILKSEIQEIH